MPKQTRLIDPIMLFFIQERLRQRKTQRVLSRLSGIDYRMLQRLEQGERVVDIVQIRRLCDALNIPLSHISLYEGYSSDEQAIIRSLPAEIRDQLLILAGSISKELNKFIG
ncbi:helix-turn-helix domain-containing protein [Vibrio aestuarianus]|uniref:HTH cro/C1-type domain-containing protein n=1 Tax=Vibrio aestuarianus TaxID=28171 RepID=A0ABM9FR77_9VIBR|nr:helix-turn-helix transcriptional regulator [Vibrio aestuarianus]MDE1213782.1 helix-turn-helix domain-containing protein [Vibrio aestuarianus]MDE1217239.1 helix-turn-helix domain-containing protein [Vibrio aestuarianus]MDE1256979.1 helix-turn-helix domain-containing protein [Vibrio aestuarianus]MDE1260780.1 helix-turn-helix domain-containing protein [Vibrio aestuarianus]MDE1267576.1 helix-turn-helix domain-containing protein [Vibrio aestuarianus]